MRVHNGFLVVLMALIMSLMGVVHLEAAAAQQTDGGQQSDGGTPPHDDGGPPVEEYGSDDTSGDGGGLGWALLLIVALVFIDRVRRVNARVTRRPKVSASTHNATLGALVSIDRLWRASGLSRSPKGSDSTQDVSHVGRAHVRPGGENREGARAGPGASWDRCVVVNEEQVVLGLLREKDLASDPAATAGEAMRPGPTTVRPDMPAGKMAERMQKRDTAAVLVTTPDGELVGMMYREEAEQVTAEQA